MEEPKIYKQNVCVRDQNLAAMVTVSEWRGKAIFRESQVTNKTIESFLFY